MPEVTFSNPRTQATVEDYPLGGSKRGPMRFWVEKTKRGERCIRQSTGKPKADTYGDRVVIVDGSDGRTYVLKWTKLHGFVGIGTADFMNADVVTNKHGRLAGAAFPDDPAYPVLMGLIEQTPSPAAS